MRRDEREEEIRRALGDLRPPDEDDAVERAVALASAAKPERVFAGGRSRRFARGAVLAGLGAAVVAGVALTPAGADVREWVADAIDDEPAVERQALTRLPAGGDVLVDSEAGTWLQDEDGSRRLLGGYEQSTFSPNGLYVAATRGDQLTALEPGGQIRWSITRPASLADPRWAPSGFRIAFRQGRSLGVVAGDGTAARSVAGNVAAIAPSWRPPAENADPGLAPNLLTYADARGSLHTIDVDGDPLRELWVRTPLRQPMFVDWIDHDRLVVASSRQVLILDDRGRTLSAVPLPREAAVESLAASPAGDRLAIVLTDAAAFTESPSRLYLARIAGGEPRERTVFSGFGRFGTPAFSPDGEWILLPWIDTDQWLLISPSEDRKLLRRVVAVGEIARQFDPGGRGPAEAPVVSGWCCD